MITPLWSYALIALYFACLVLLSLFSAHRYIMLYFYYRYRPKSSARLAALEQLPRVTLQLPLFNERYVVERLLQSVAQIDYPADKLQVQILDDSTDETREIARERSEELRKRGLNVELIQRSDRTGYKAGALQNGLKSATGEFIAIFDADFVPSPDFLRQALPHFADPRVGLVQLRWEHLNRHYSFLTRLQSIMLDGHFVIEHAARHYAGRFFNFNGTAGIWRKDAIADAGGWQHDTLTEDLDLSYRAQLRGWKFVYVPAVTAPAELPVEMNAFKTQQHRWTKGSIQTALKLLPQIWRSRFSLAVKIEATFHLANNFAYLFMLMVALLMGPVMLARESVRLVVPFWVDLLLFCAATVSIGTFYLASQREILPNWRRQLALMPFMMSLGVGLCVNNAKAVIEALLGIGSGFVRTPKTGVGEQREQHWRGAYLSPASRVALIESLLALYYLGIVAYCVVHQNFLTLPFMMLFLFGFGYVGLLSLAPMFSAHKTPKDVLPKQ